MRRYEIQSQACQLNYSEEHNTTWYDLRTCPPNGTEFTDSSSERLLQVSGINHETASIPLCQYYHRQNPVILSRTGKVSWDY
jgi:hypothetical protein